MSAKINSERTVKAITILAEQELDLAEPQFDKIYCDNNKEVYIFLIQSKSLRQGTAVVIECDNVWGENASWEVFDRYNDACVYFRKEVAKYL